MRKQLLSDAIDSYEKHRKGLSLTKNTLRIEKSVLVKLLTCTGNIYTTSLTGDHVDEIMDVLGETNSPRSMANYFHTLNGFFRWMHGSERIRRNPFVGRKPPKFSVEERRRLPAVKFPELLDAARTPRDRALMALGLYLLSRSQEIAKIRIGDIQGKFIRTHVSKQTGRTKMSSDLMPITKELRAELGRWLGEYEAACGPLQSHWYLIPAMSKPNWHENPDGPGAIRYQHYVPERHSGYRQNLVVQEALEAIGFATRNDDGSSRNEGMHTLRRSGARARFDALRSMGYDGAIREVMKLLHHAHATMTELYIGIDLDNLKRDEALIDQWMYPQIADHTTTVEPIDLAKFLPGAPEPDPGDVIDLASRRKPRPVQVADEPILIWPGGRGEHFRQPPKELRISDNLAAHLEDS